MKVEAKADLLMPGLSSPGQSAFYPASDASSFRSSAFSDMESDDDDDIMYRPMQSEYEEIPSFRWLTSPLRPRRTKGRPDQSEKAVPQVAAAIGSAKAPPAAGTEVESGGQTATEPVHFDGQLVFTLDEFPKSGLSVAFLGQGSCGSVYRVTLEDGRQVAVRSASSAAAGISTEDFDAKVNLLGKIRHPKGQKWLFLDHKPLGSLSAFLHGCSPDTTIDWPTRMNIAIGITKGLHYLHTQRNIVHGNLTSGNVLLDDQNNARIADYVPSRFKDTAAIISDRAFRAPELSKLKKANTQTDVYSLGMIILELLTGMSASHIDLPRMRSSIIEGWTWEDLDEELMRNAVGSTRGELLNTLFLALQCVAPSPYARPKVLQVLQQLKQIKQESAIPLLGTTTATRGDEPTEKCASTAGGPATVPPTTGIDISSSPSSDMLEERMGLPCEAAGIRTSETADVSADDGNLRAGMTENILSCLLVSPASGAEAMPTSAEELFQGYKGEEELHAARLGDVVAPPHSKDQSPVTNIEASAAESVPLMPCWTGDSSINWSTADQTVRSNRAPLSSINMDELPKSGQAQPTEDSDSCDQVEEVPKPLPVVDRTGDTLNTEGNVATSRGGVVATLPSITWPKVPLVARIEVPTTPTLISSEPDLGYQRYFQALYELAHRSPPLPSMVLEAQLNQMVMGLHSLGYPLATWLRAATLVLVSAEKREYIERNVNDYRVHVETQLAEFTSVIDPVKQEMARLKSHATAHEQEKAHLEDQLAVLQARRDEVADSLAAVQDRLRGTEAKMESVSAEMDVLNRQYSAIPDLRSAMLQELPALDEAFDFSFREIMTKKF